MKNAVLLVALLALAGLSGCTGKFVKVDDSVGSAVQRIGDKN